MNLHQQPASIRLASDEDGEAIAALVASVFAEYPGCLFVPEEMPEFAAVATHYRAKGGTIWVAERGARLIGSFAIMASGAPATFELSKVYLDRTARGLGIAGRLYGEALAFAKARSASRLELFTDTKFTDGHRFYERLGFQRLPGERFLGDASDTWEFHYALAI